MNSVRHSSADFVISAKFRRIGVYLLLVVIAKCSGGWIDPDTQADDKLRKSFVDNRDYELVFSDEFNVGGRTFHDGKDSRWTAIDKNDYTNFALHYYKADLAKTSNGFLNISTIIEDITFSIPGPVGTNIKKSKTKNYQSAMVNGWNKFCFTGGMIEISAQLPGLPNAGGLWPAMWLLGNLARATYVGSSNNVWPWSYDSCSKDLQREQAISACNEVNHFGLHPFQGRGAPEIDILEAMSGTGEQLPGTNVTRKPYFSTSFQVAPSIANYRPEVATRPEPGSWYEQGIIYGDKNKTDINVFFYGLTLEGATPDLTYTADALSSNTRLSATHFNSQHKYRLEWIPGPEGYLRWYLDDEFLYGVDAIALNVTGAIIPEEPMYLLLNTAISSTWGFPQPCPEGCPCDCFDCRKVECECAIPFGMCDNFPAFFLIDYVRVYQAVGDDSQIVGCSTPKHPSSRYIKGHESKFMAEGDKMPLQPIAQGGAECESDVQCGFGSCVRMKCLCQSGFEGPNCLASHGYDDIKWEADEDKVNLSLMVVPVGLVILVLLLALALVGVVSYKYYFDKNARGGWRVGAEGRYMRVVEMAGTASPGTGTRIGNAVFNTGYHNNINDDSQHSSGRNSGKATNPSSYEQESGVGGRWQSYQ